MAYGKGGYKKGNNAPKKEYVTVGSIVLFKNVGFDESRVGQEGAPPLFNGFYSLGTDDNEVIAKLVLWKRPDFDGDTTNALLASGKDSQGNVVFLRVSDRDNIQFFGNIITKVPQGETAEPIANITLFSGDNKSCWSGSLQVEAGGQEAQKKQTKSTTTAKAPGKQKPSLPY